MEFWREISELYDDFFFIYLFSIYSFLLACRLSSTTLPLCFLTPSAVRVLDERAASGRSLPSLFLEHKKQKKTYYDTYQFLLSDID